MDKYVSLDAIKMVTISMEVIQCEDVVDYYI